MIKLLQYLATQIAMHTTEPYIEPVEDQEKALKWWNELYEEQRIMLKEEFSDILGIDYFTLRIMFSEDEMITILYQKLIIEGILEDE